jgi:hypothetical protein
MTVVQLEAKIALLELRIAQLELGVKVGDVPPWAMPRPYPYPVQPWGPNYPAWPYLPTITSDRTDSLLHQ